jgi:hypothetical protein
VAAAPAVQTDRLGGLRGDDPDDQIDLPLHPGADDDVFESADLWEAGAGAAAPPEAPRRGAGVAAVALAGLALGALIVVAGVRGLGLGSDPPNRHATPATVSSISPAVASVPSAQEPTAPPAVAAAPIAPAAAPGRLRVESDPVGALVTIDGRHVGGTPATADNLPLGSHTVQVARSGFVPAQTRVTLTAAAPARDLRLSLQPGLSPPGLTTPAGPSGAIDVDSRPRGARVSIDGRFVGNAPLRLADLEPGAHALLLEMAGYAGASRRVQVEPGGVARLIVSLE